MAVQVNPITPSLPATTSIQDPAARKFAQAVQDTLNALRSEAGSVELLSKAASVLSGAAAGGVPPSIAQWLLSSELYWKLNEAIQRVDVAAKQDVLDEALARQTALDEINATLATIQSTAAYDAGTTYAIGDMVTYDGKLYQAIAATTGNLPTNTTYWKKVGDYASLGDVVAAHTLGISTLDSRVNTVEGNLTAEISSRETLASQVRGTYTGTNVNLVTQGLIYSERVARVSGDGANASSISALRAQVGVTEGGALTTGLILDEENVRASNDMAIVSAVNTALAQITGVSTSISQSGQNLIANWTQAQATKWSQIEAEVLTAGGQTVRAAIAAESTTRASQTGELYAQYTVKLDTNGYIAGFGLASESSAAGGSTSSFIIRADKFALVMPGYGNYVPFAIGPSGAELSVPVSAEFVAGANLLPTPDLGLGDSTTANGWDKFQAGNVQYCLRSLDTNYGPPWDTSQYFFYSNLSDSTGQTRWMTSDFIPVGPNTNYCVSAWVRSLSGTSTGSYLGVMCYNSAGTALSYLYPNGLLAMALTTTWTHKKGVFGPGHTAFPAGTVKVRVVWRGSYQGSGASLATRFCFNEGVVPSKSVMPYDTTQLGKYNPITPSNVTTYIANAAIGNAQIGGDIWSSNFVAGSAGWRIYRDGNAEFRNVVARGDIEASSLKVGIAMVDVLNLKGSAVIIPLQISYAAKSVNLPYSQGVWHAQEAFNYTLSLSTGGLFKFSFIGSFFIDHWVGHANFGSGFRPKAIRIYIDGALIETYDTVEPNSGGTFTLSHIEDIYHFLGAGNHDIVISMEAIMADGGARVQCSGGSVTIQSFQTGSSSV